MTWRIRTAALLLPAALLLTGCATSAATQTQGAAGSETLLPAREADENRKPVKPPAKAEIGQWYPHDFTSHCGLHSTEFAARTWLLRTVRTDLPSPVEKGTWSVAKEVFAGYMQLESADLAVFASVELPPIELVPGETDFACR
ncbi:hypothetical protein H9Y04_20685 [Streptomyces sp. TRM66268-LWL]|uniref:Lipoprotein n=1 Tax=Streptomyces polyasparticus TaxID=2767826 RepID=A0ABR7SJU8_9ACTN|nr:hypothetical protein [Streptomyces polyasparticus]MBC9714970.1 hypothetical protein [Streptomyces polyasparticus]